MNCSGRNLAIWGDEGAGRSLLIPDPDSGEQDCVLKADGQCPAGCCECVTFRLEMENFSRVRELEESSL